MMGCGVPLGAKAPNQVPVARGSGTPVSASVGTSGKSASRVADAVASSLALPCLTYCSMVTSLLRSTRPAIRSIEISAAPL